MYASLSGFHRRLLRGKALVQRSLKGQSGSAWKNSGIGCISTRGVSHSKSPAGSSSIPDPINQPQAGVKFSEDGADPGFGGTVEFTSGSGLGSGSVSELELSPTEIGKLVTTESFFAQTRRELSEAMTLPPIVYYDATVFEIEKTRVWEKSWTCVGYASRLRRHGDTIQRTVGNENVIITRDKQGNLHAFKNVCRHRGATLVREDGRYPVLSCKYHRWAYAPDGRLVAAPSFSFDDSGNPIDTHQAGPNREGNNVTLQPCPAIESQFKALEKKDFNKKDYPLIPVRMATLGHLIFVNISGDAPPLEEYLGSGYPDGGLMAQIEEHLPSLADNDRVISVKSRKLRSKANWKLLVENFIEYYHLPSVHPSLTTVSAVDDHHRTQVGGNHMSFITRPLTAAGTPIDPGVLPHFGNLSQINNHTAWFHAIFPNVFYFLLPHHVFTVIVTPDYQTIQNNNHMSGLLSKHVGMSIEDIDLTISKQALDDPEYEEKIQRMWEFMDMTNDEDIDICETVQRGVQTKGYEGGRFSFRFEETIHRFQNMYIDHMIGSPRVVPGDSESPPGAQRFLG